MALDAAASSGYKLVELPALEPGESQALAINSQGDVVGYGTAEDGTSRATFWPAGREPRELGTLGGRASSALGINDGGDIVGNSEAADGSVHATLWPRGADPVDLGLVSGTASYATSINRSGTVAGYRLAGAQPRAIVWPADGRPPVELTPFQIAEALAIANSGEVAGFSYTATASPRAFLWSGAATTATNLGGDLVSRGHAISEGGDVVGVSVVEGGPFRATAWFAADRPTPRILRSSWDVESIALGVNNAGDIVGTDFETRDRPHATLWRAGSYDSPSVLPDDGSSGSRARSINSGGVIAGSGTDAAGKMIAVIWLPLITNQPPTITAPPDLAVLTDVGVCSAYVDPGTATASDDQPGVDVRALRSDALPRVGSYPAGTTSITWTATDVLGLTATAVQAVTVSDGESPIVTAPSDKTVDNDPHRGLAAVVTGGASATDNCGSVTVLGSRSDGASVGDPYPVGITVITWTGRDAGGNTGSATQLITVRDVEPPSLFLPSALNVNATSPAGASVAFTVTATDNVGTSGATCTPAAGSAFPIGTTLVTCRAVDGAGNSASGNFSVTVVGAPEQIAGLIESLAGKSIPSTQRSLLIKFLSDALGNAKSARLACASLNLFIRAISAQVGTVFTQREAMSLINDAKRIEAVLGCA